MPNDPHFAVERGVPTFFSPRFPNLFPFGLMASAEAASFYDTTALAATLRDWNMASKHIYFTLNQRLTVTQHNKA